MFAYNYEVLSTHKEKPKSKTFLSLEEKETLHVDKNYILHLHNNQFRKVSITSNKDFSNITKNQSINFLVENIVSFNSKVGSNKIDFTLEKDGTMELMNYWLYHTFLPILFTIENKYYFLHAGAVHIEDKAVLFIANSFGGKSTLTDYFIQKNHTMISDDKVGTYVKDNKIISTPSYEYHRPYRKMEDLGIKVENFAKENKEIFCIFNLIKSDATSEINISEIFGIEKFKALRYATDIDLTVNKEDRFKSLANIANNTSVYNISIPWDLDRLPEVYNIICSFIKKGNK
jgi:hypothetical protein